VTALRPPCYVERSKAAFVVLQRASQQRHNALFAQRSKNVDPATGEQRGNDLKGWVFCCCPDQANGAALHVRKKSILLRLVEAVDFIDKKNGSRV